MMILRVPNETRVDVNKLMLSEDFEEFIECLYRAILGRLPDEKGALKYLSMLNAGSSKIEIIINLYESVERKSKGISINGLSRIIFIHKILQVPVVGPILRFIGVKDFDDLGIKDIRVIRNIVYMTNKRLQTQFDQINHDISIITQDLATKFPTLENRSSIESEVIMSKSSSKIIEEIAREEFDGEWYLSQYHDVANAKIDPYDHYINIGKKERRIGMRKGSGYPQIKPITSEQYIYLKKQLESWPRLPLISILMPVFNTSESWLREAIESVINQIYTEWELCIADDFSTDPNVKRVIDEYIAADSRIKVTYRKNNGRVSAASNTALAMANGEFTALFDHDDILEPHAIFHIAESVVLDFPDFIYSDEVLISEDSDKIIGNVFRPMFSLELLRSHPYIVHLVAFRTSILRQIGGFDERLTISQDYDLVLRFIERADHIVHIAKVLYRWRIHGGSAGHTEQDKVVETSKKIILDHLKRCGEPGHVTEGKVFNFFDVRYAIGSKVKVAVIIPTKNHWELVRQCIESIDRTVSKIDYDIIIIDHDSDDVASKKYFNDISKIHKILNYAGEFNFSKINNWAVNQLEPIYTHLLFCNNDIEAIHPGWLDRMVEIAQKSDVGIVGAKLYYPKTEIIQHAGVCVGMFGAAEHYGKFMDKNIPDGGGIHPGYIGSLIANREMSAVTAACMLMRRDVFERVRGFDELAKVGFGDVDICLRVRESGYRIIFCAHAELIHHESISRGKSSSDPHPEDSAYFLNRWGKFIARGDPYYNPNLTLYNTYWSLKRSEEFEMESGRGASRRSFINLNYRNGSH